MRSATWSARSWPNRTSAPCWIAWPANTGCSHVSPRSSRARGGRALSAFSLRPWGAPAASPLLDLLRESLEGRLMENPYYRHAVAGGQLAPVEITVLDPEGGAAWLLYERRCLDEGQKWGNIK